MRRTNHDLALKRQLLRDRDAKCRFVHVFAHDECTDGADVNDAELRQLFRDYRRLASIRRTDVYCSKKDD
jgi:hypothetical protein